MIMPSELIDKVINSASEDRTDSDVFELDSPKLDDKSYLDIYNGDAFSNTEINTYLAEDFSNVIVLGGLPNNGKTTLISCIYDKFIQYGEFQNFEFVNTKTIIGFEKRSYLARLASGQQPNTRRTHRDENPFLHLTLNHRDKDSIKRLILVDTSGEVFEDFRKNSSNITNFKAITRANHFSYIFDISLFDDTTKKHSAKSAMKTIFRGIQDMNMFPPNIKIELIFTKWDKIKEENRPAAEKYIKSIIEELKLIIVDKPIDYFKINSLSDSELFELPELFQHWLQTSTIHDYTKKITEKKIDWVKDYQKYLDYE